jgi:Fe2+ transport system protein FeoA
VSLPPPPQTLADWPLGRPAVLLGTRDPGSLGVRLAHLGLRAGALVTPVLRTSGKGVVLASGELRVALDRATAAAVAVGEPRHEPDEPGGGMP